MTTTHVLASIFESLANLAAPWKDLYDDHTSLSIAVIFVHLSALLVGGGLALASDRATLRAIRGTADDRRHQLTQLALVHRTVITALALSFVSGVALFLADVETFSTSIVYWTKMGLVALLLLNGFLMTRAEAALRSGATDEATGWRRLRGASIASGVLWLATLLAGVTLTNA